MRDPTAAGTFYERNPELLKAEIEAHYEGPRGPGALALNYIDHDIKAIIVPNSPYRNCGDCMAWGYKALAESPIPDVYVIIATNQASQEGGMTINTFTTPLGFARVDQVLARKLEKTLEYNDEIHMMNNVIEVQLPFLIHAKYQQMEKIKILPVLLDKGMDIKDIASNIKEAIKGKKVIFIVSSDLTHYGPLFHYEPFTTDIQKNVYALDQGAIDLIKKQDADGFNRYAKEKTLNYHGTAAIELLLRIIGPCTVTLESYYTSADILNDDKNVVGYAAIVFE